MSARDIRRVFRTLYAAEMVKTNAALTTRLHQLQLEAVRHGAARNSWAATHIDQAVTASMETRAEIAFTMLMECVRTHGVTIDDTAKTDLLQMLCEQLQHEAETLDHLARSPGPVGGPPPQSVLVETHVKVHEVVARAMATFEAQLRQMLAEMKNGMASPPPSPVGDTANVTGPIGEIKSGSGNPSVVQHIYQTDKDTIMRALDLVEAALQRDGPPAFEVDAVRELIADARAEMAKEKPSPTKLGAFLFGIGRAIRTTNALPHVDEAVNRAASRVGVNLL